MKTAITISGGYDSAAAFILFKNKNNCDFIFFDYGQIYKDNELKCALKFSKYFNKELKIINLPLGHDSERRNFHFLMHLKSLNYSQIVMGCRNILPIFDKYKDSNWLNLKAFSFLINITVNLPVVLMNKKSIIKILKSTGLEFYNCYNNKLDKNCKCKNCLEMSRL